MYNRFLVKQLRIYVTEADIAAASYGSSGCPVARAVSRVLGAKVFVGPKEVWFTALGKINNRISYLPEEACKFLLGFDRPGVVDRKDLKPFSFLLDVPKAITSAPKFLDHSGKK